jgi:hypothetical protein
MVRPASCGERMASLPLLIALVVVILDLPVTRIASRR